LLEGQRALKELAAVQAAAENKMAFKQCTSVAENLENFVLSHRPEFPVSGPKFQANPQMTPIFANGVKKLAQVFKICAICEICG
jgi:hypothetical protein